MALSSEDKQIIGKMLKRDEKTLLSFYRKNSARLQNYIRQQIKDQTTAEEIAQDAFIDFIDALPNFKEDASVKTYLYSIARHKIIDYIRKRKIKQILFSALPFPILEKITTFVFDDRIDRLAMQEKIAKTFDRLPNDYRVILRLKYIEGDKVKEIAEKLSLSYKATESLIFRARRAFIKFYRISNE